MLTSPPSCRKHSIMMALAAFDLNENSFSDTLNNLCCGKLLFFFFLLVLLFDRSHYMSTSGIHYSTHPLLLLFVLHFSTVCQSDYHQPSFSTSTPSQTDHLWHRTLLSGCFSMASPQPTIHPTNPPPLRHHHHLLSAAQS